MAGYHINLNVLMKIVSQGVQTSFLVFDSRFKNIFMTSARSVQVRDRLHVYTKVSSFPEPDTARQRHSSFYFRPPLTIILLFSLTSLPSFPFGK